MTLYRAMYLSAPYPVMNLKDFYLRILMETGERDLNVDAREFYVSLVSERKQKRYSSEVCRNLRYIFLHSDRKIRYNILDIVKKGRIENARKRVHNLYLDSSYSNIYRAVCQPVSYCIMK